MSKILIPSFLIEPTVNSPPTTKETIIIPDFYKEQQLTIPTFLQETATGPSIPTDVCYDYCEANCQSCQDPCQICQAYCENSCTGCTICTSCEAVCESACMDTCTETCTTCQSSCLSSCQEYCENMCTSGCQDECTSYCQENCQSSCEISCQYSCTSGCTVGCTALNQTPASPNIRYISQTINSITVGVYAIDTLATGINVNCTDTTSGALIGSQSAGTDGSEYQITFTNLTYGHSFTVTACSSGAFPGGCHSVNVTINCARPTLVYVSKTGTSVTMTLGSPAYTGWTSLAIHTYLQGAGTPTKSDAFTTAGNKTITGLTPGNIYVFYAQATYSGTSYEYSDPPVIVSLKQFAWATPKVKGQPFSLTDDEWNELTTFVNAIRQAKGLALATFTSAVTGNKLTATMFNQVVNAINAMTPPTSPPLTIADPQPVNLNNRDKVTADRLNLIVSSINSIT